MRLTITLLLVALAIHGTAQPVDKRIITNDATKYRDLAAVHAGAGTMAFTQLIGRTELSANFLYLHAGVIDGKSGIGHHFHHTIEEMYVILNGEAEFTINGRTSVIKAPAVVPCKMGDSHGIYNASDDKIKWLNFAVSDNPGRGDAFDLGDTRVGATIEPIPQFVSGRLERDKMRTNPDYSGRGVLHRRIFRSEVFTTDWNHVDHLIIPPGSSTGPRQLLGVEEVYYTISGSGKLTIDGKSANFKADDAFYGKLGETIALSNEGSGDLELLIIGVAPSKEKGLSVPRQLIEPKATVLQMDFIVARDKAEAFEKMYYSIYVPAMTVQEGYLESKLLRMYSPELSKSIEAEPSTYNYQIQISFDTEENRVKWVKSDQHQIAWPAASGLAEKYKWRGYDVMGDDYNK